MRHQADANCLEAEFDLFHLTITFWSGQSLLYCSSVCKPDSDLRFGLAVVRNHCARNFASGGDALPTLEQQQAIARMNTTNRLIYPAHSTAQDPLLQTASGR